MQNKMMAAAVTAATAVSFMLALSACSLGVPEVEAAPEDEVTTSAPPEDTAAPEDARGEKAQAPGGSRDNPLKRGEARQISEQSAFTVSFGKTESYGECIAVPITVQVDWHNFEQQMKNNGQDTTDLSAQPFFSLSTSFVTKVGKTYDAATGDGCIDAFTQLGDKANIAQEIYPPTMKATNMELIQVPESERAGGVWAVQNSVGEKVFGVN
ncbi:hypothetical protein GCM10028784_36700 [Myceligenerans cantabricum]